MILDAAGRPFETVAETLDEAKMENLCQHCGEVDGHNVIVGLGGYWHMVCKCGNKVRSGRGDAPGR